MKKILICILSAIILLFFISCENKNTQKDKAEHESSPNNPAPEEMEDKEMEPIPEIEVINYENIKAMWLSQFDLQNIYTDQGVQRQKDDFQAKIKAVLTNVKSNGFNTVFLQIRPNADSFYPSQYYPSSKYVTGDYKNDFLYDPLPVILDEAHKLGLSIHAWINPLRAMTSEEIQSVRENFLIKKWYKEKYGTFLVEFSGRYYLNPAYTETRQLIIDGVKEIVENYNFDGVHMDDYFYPTTSENFDLASYTEYKSKGGTLSLKQYRYDNLNKLVSGIYSAVKEKSDQLLYGISPEGNMSNATDKAYADVYTWCSEKGYIDYISPQIYFGLEHQTCPFDKTSEKWASIIKNEDIKLIIGMTFGKALSKTDKWAGNGKGEWEENSDVMKRCLEYTENIDKCSGVSVFCYQYYYEPLTGADVEETKTERDNFTPILKDIQWN